MNQDETELRSAEFYSAVAHHHSRGVQAAALLFFISLGALAVCIAIDRGGLGTFSMVLTIFSAIVTNSEHKRYVAALKKL